MLLLCVNYVSFSSTVVVAQRKNTDTKLCQLKSEKQTQRLVKDPSGFTSQVTPAYCDFGNRLGQLQYSGRKVSYPTSKVLLGGRSS